MIVWRLGFERAPVAGTVPMWARVNPYWLRLGDENNMTCVAATRLGRRLHGFTAAGRRVTEVTPGQAGDWW